MDVVVETDDKRDVSQVQEQLQHVSHKSLSSRIEAHLCGLDYRPLRL